MWCHTNTLSNTAMCPNNYLSSPCECDILRRLTDGYETISAFRLRIVTWDTNWPNGQPLCLWDVNNDTSHKEKSNFTFDAGT